MSTVDVEEIFRSAYGCQDSELKEKANIILFQYVETLISHMLKPILILFLHQSPSSKSQ